MPTVEVLGSGTTPLKSDTKRLLLIKRLMSLINGVGTLNVNNYPFKGDTCRMLRVKIDRVLTGQ